ncbi:MAG: RHS repeat protein [Candidatus Obscuribacter sp.]|nr:RHS repeat protein [Candidatus Obscuribacter sp.]
MSASSGINLAIYQASPMLWGSIVDTNTMTLVCQAAPFVVANQPPGAKYVNDSLGRLSQIIYTNQTTVTFNYDAAGNRTSVVTVCPTGLC